MQFVHCASRAQQGRAEEERDLARVHRPIHQGSSGNRGINDRIRCWIFIKGLRLIEKN